MRVNARWASKVANVVNARARERHVATMECARQQHRHRLHLISLLPWRRSARRNMLAHISLQRDEQRVAKQKECCTVAT
eukprot:650337-Lingulodinium_polyedra.AAC.1